MIIATWNIERLKHKKDIDKILNACDQIKADILVLTETDKQVQPDYKYCFETPSPYEINPSLYKPTENRVSVFTNYRCIRQYETYDKYTSICIELETEKGNLTVYATIMGIYRNRHPTFKEDLLKQTADFKNIAAGGKNLCIIGDFNCSFADNYYFTTFGRNTLLKSFEENKIRLLTGYKRECIDHIAISQSFIKNSEPQVKEWNENKVLFDHKGIFVFI